MYNGLNLLRGIAAFGIVGCHLSLCPRTTGGEYATSLCDFNVGLFAAISGFLMPQTNSGFRYVTKRASRIIPVYLVWSVIYVVVTAIFDLVLDGGSLDARYYNLSNWMRVVFWGNAATHLWFLICLLYCQVLLYYANIGLCKIFGNARGVVLWGLSILSLIVSVAGHTWWCCYPIRLMSFLLLGFALKPIKKVAFCGALGCTLTMAVVHVCAHEMLPWFVRDYMLVVPTILLFVSSKFTDNRVASVLATTSMGVYLVHPLFARGVSLVVIRTFASPYNAFVVVGEWLCVWVLSLITAIILVKLPFTGRFVR